jgi:hypothetical protein
LTKPNFSCPFEHHVDLSDVIDHEHLAGFDLIHHQNTGPENAKGVSLYILLVRMFFPTYPGFDRLAGLIPRGFTNVRDSMKIIRSISAVKEISRPREIVILMELELMFNWLHRLTKWIEQRLIHISEKATHGLLNI